MQELLEKFIEFINVKSIETMGINIIIAIAVVLLTLWFSRKLQRIIERHFPHDNFEDQQAVRKYKITAKIVIMIFGILLAIHVLGIDMSAVFTSGGMFAVAMAFVTKNILGNYVSGVIIRLQGIIKSGDILESTDDHTIMKVKSIGMSSTIVTTKEEKDVVIPNSVLIENKIANYTYSNSLCRIQATVGVAYSSDLDKVQKVLENICDHCDWKSPQHEPSVILFSFGDSAVNYKVMVWIENPWVSGTKRALLNQAIWRGLKEADISIAYPQLDVHIDTLLKGQSDGSGA